MTDAPAFTFLSVEDVLSLHEDAVNTWGGTHGTRLFGPKANRQTVLRHVRRICKAAGVPTVSPQNLNLRRGEGRAVKLFE